MTHHPQQITSDTRKLLDKICKVTKRSRPQQLEILVTDHWESMKFANDLKKQSGIDPEKLLEKFNQKKT
jgi:hypothetical protein